MNMNSCPNTSKLLDYMLEMLDENEMREIGEHLKQCAECRQELKLEMAIGNALSEPMDAGMIESVVLRRVKTMREIHYPATIFGFSFWRIVFYALPAAGIVYALLVHLGKIVASEKAGVWLIRMAENLSSIALMNTWSIAIASMGLSAAVLMLFYRYRYNFSR